MLLLACPAVPHDLALSGCSLERVAPHSTAGWLEIRFASHDEAERALATFFDRRWFCSVAHELVLKVIKSCGGALRLS